MRFGVVVAGHEAPEEREGPRRPGGDAGAFAPRSRREE